MYDHPASRRGAVDRVVDNFAPLVEKCWQRCGRHAHVCGSRGVERGFGVDTETGHFHKM